MKFFGTAILIMLLVPVLVAQTGSGPCSNEKVKEFDFWLGTWDLEWTAASGEVQKGTNEITRILGGCVVREAFDGGKALPLKGQSYSMLDRQSGKWKQTWVDNQGSYLDFTGEFSNGKMVLGREFTNPQGNKVKQRMVFLDIQKDSIRWRWENSTDGGKTWNLAWEILYKRRK